MDYIRVTPSVQQAYGQEIKRWNVKEIELGTSKLIHWSITYQLFLCQQLLSTYIYVLLSHIQLLLLCTYFTVLSVKTYGNCVPFMYTYYNKLQPSIPTSHIEVLFCIVYLLHIKNTYSNVSPYCLNTYTIYIYI